MRFGLWYHLRNPAPWQQPPDRLYAETLDQIVMAEELGYHSVWASEHHFTDDAYLPSSLVWLSAVAARTARVRLGTLILLLPLHDPLRVAEDAAVVDLISGGRLDLGVAAGYRVREFEAFGVAHTERGSRVEEGVQILQRAWSDGAFSFAGRHFHYDNVDVTPKPLQKPYPPIWMGGHTKVAIRRAARLGCHLLPDTTTDFDVLGVYQEALREYGRDSRAFRIKCFRFLYCCEDAEAGWRDVRQHLLYQHNLYRRWARDAGDDTAKELTEAAALPRSGYIVGPPEECERAIRELHRRMPFEEFVFWAYPPGFPVSRANRSIELFARSVMPRFH